MINRKNKEAMFSMVRQWQESGLSQAEFSRKHKLNNKTLNNWIKQFKEAEPQINNNFVPLITETSNNCGSPIFVRYPNGVEIELPETINFTKLKELINL